MKIKLISKRDKIIHEFRECDECQIVRDMLQDILRVIKARYMYAAYAKNKYGRDLLDIQMLGQRSIDNDECWGSRIYE